jgi:hypothetical protein
MREAPPARLTPCHIENPQPGKYHQVTKPLQNPSRPRTRNRMGNSVAGAQLAHSLRYNSNFPHVPFGTICNDQICVCHWRRRVFPW